jgi:hypothetical protein
MMPRVYASAMRRFVAPVAFACAAVACSSPAQPPAPRRDTPAAPAPWAVTVAPASVAAAPGSMAPQLTRSASGVVASWLETGDAGRVTLKYAERTAAGWSRAQTVASGSDWFVSWADVPSVSRLADGTLVAQWLKNVDPTIEAYDLRLSTSHDNGRTWTTAFSPHHDKTRTQHGFASLFAWPDAGGSYGLVWLDGRDQELNTKDAQGGAMALYYARYDRSGKQMAEAAVNERVCECCSTSVAMTSEGPVAAFRDRSDTEVRDIAVSRFDGGAATWSSPAVVHADNWTIDSCPVNGPAIAADGTTVAVAWFTMKGEQGHAYAAFSRDAGRSFGEPIRLDDATSLGHVGIEMLPGGAAAATWVEFTDARARLRVRRIEPSGTKSAPVEIAGAGAGHVGGQPRIARAGNDLVLAWTESQSEGDEGPGQQVQVATVTLP